MVLSDLYPDRSADGILYLNPIYWLRQIYGCVIIKRAADL